MKRSDNKKKWVFLYEKYMICIGLLTEWMFYLQAYKIFHSKSAGSTSALAFSLAGMGLGSWLIYGLFLKDKALIISSAVGVIGVLCVLIGIILYG